MLGISSFKNFNPTYQSYKEDKNADTETGNF